MGENFYLDDGLMRHVTTKLAAVGDDFGASQKKLTETLKQYEGCWGEDDIGKGFAKQYCDDADKVLTGTGKDGEYLTDAATTTQKSADNLNKLDEDAAKRIDSRVPLQNN